MALKEFEKGLSFLNKKDYKKALDSFEKAVSKSDNLQLIARCESYIAYCKEKLNENKEEAEFDYGYAVFLLNKGEFEESKKLLNSIFKNKKEQDDTYFYLYALAEAGCNNRINAEKFLKKAIKLNPSLKFTAKREPIFKNLSLDFLES